MSSLHSGFKEFKEKGKVKNVIIIYTRKHNKILIYVYCLQKDIDIKNEENKLKFVCYKHGICYQYGYGQPLWELPTLTQIISIFSSYSSTYVFSFKKKEKDFFNILIFLYFFFLSLENSKEMSINIHATNISLYFDDHLMLFKSKKFMFCLYGKMYSIYIFKNQKTKF